MNSSFAFVQICYKTQFKNLGGCGFLVLLLLFLNFECFSPCLPVFVVII